MSICFLHYLHLMSLGLVFSVYLRSCGIRLKTSLFLSPAVCSYVHENIGFFALLTLDVIRSGPFCLTSLKS